MVDKKLAKRIIDFLNSLLETDRDVIEKLITYRLPCSKYLEYHPTVQVSCHNKKSIVGLLGLLNGLCGVYENGEYKGRGPITVVFDNNGNIVEFRFTDEN